MSVPSPFAPRNPPAEAMEDCRDYLRTGRCKYGASCKYNHPANVQTGGGMKMPLDPSEPMFPVRPNEPICQYYMKHGTCKFGQTCKFHHPPQSQLSALNGNAMPGGARKNDVPQMLWNSTDSNVQLLPQRPDEPNCIFFLKNGRCKYGSTCRYHHPLSYHDRTRNGPDEGRRGNDGGPKIHYVTQLPPGSYQQGHFVVADGTVAFLTLDGNGPAQVIPVSQAGNGDAAIYTSSSSASRPLGHSRDLPASTSSPSIASSYDTALSNMDMMGSHGDSSASSLWNRPRRNNSSNSLSAYQEGGRQHIIQGGRTVYVQNMGDSNGHLPRVSSISSHASENGSVYYDPPQTLGRSGSSSHMQLPSGTVWRGRRSNSFDHGGPGSYGREDDMPPEGGSGHYRPQEGARSPMMRNNRPPQTGRRRHPQGAEDDDGLSMMTSALLTMLDTPEEVAGEHYDGYYDEQSMPSSQMSTPQMRPVDFPIKDNDDSPDTPRDARLYQGGQYPPSNAYYSHPSAADDRVLPMSLPDSRSRINDQYEARERYHQGSSSTEEFLPWQGSSHGSRPLSESGHALPQSQHPSNSPHAASNVGLYLP